MIKKIREMKKNAWILTVAIAVLIAFSCNSPEKGQKDNQTDNQTGEVSVEGKTASFDETISGQIPVLVDFYADWCQPCKSQSPIIDELKTEMGDKLIVIKVNVDIETEITERYQIQSIPTLMIFKDGEMIWKAVGLQQKSVLSEAVLAAQ
ncbi:MAG: thioredoxin [Bacteroidales bacterium]|nr:thioredoxin [Bacteroidales bacterium]